MTHVTCRLTAKNRDKLRKHTLGNRVWAIFTFLELRATTPFYTEPTITDVEAANRLRI